VKGFFLYEDNDTGVPTKMLWRSDHDGHAWRHPSGDWLICDTYSIDGWQYLFMFHLPTAKFVPLGKFAVKAREGDGTFRVDLHPRVSPDGNTVSIDSAHEFAGRQIDNIDISHIVTRPPTEREEFPIGKDRLLPHRCGRRARQRDRASRRSGRP
jgi:hypothetical protein